MFWLIDGLGTVSAYGGILIVHILAHRLIDPAIQNSKTGFALISTSPIQFILKLIFILLILTYPYSQIPSLINHFRSGNLNMEEIIEIYRKRVFGFLFNYIKIRSEAEDLTQDVMVKLLENEDKFNNVEDMDSYILTIAHHVVMDHFKKLQRDKKYKEKVWNQIQRSEKPVLRKVYENDFLENIEKALHSLPARQQAVFRMNRLEGLSLDEIAEKLKISPYTVKNHLAEATRKMKMMVKPEYFLLVLLLVN